MLTRKGWGQRERTDRDTSEMPWGNCHNHFQCEAFARTPGSLDWDTDSCDRSPQRCLPECFCVQPVQHDLSRSRKRFVSLNGINSLVTFGQPWHNCAINVTDSFAGCSWLVLNHHYVAVCSADALLHRLFLLLLVVLVKMDSIYLNKMYSCGWHANGKLWHMAVFFFFLASLKETKL